MPDRSRAKQGKPDERRTGVPGMLVGLVETRSSSRKARCPKELGYSKAYKAGRKV